MLPRVLRPDSSQIPGSSHDGPFVVSACINMVITSSKSKDQPSKIVNPARGQLNRKTLFPSLGSHLRIWSRKMGSAIPFGVSLHITIPRLNLALTYGIPPEFRGGVYLLI